MEYRVCMHVFHEREREREREREVVKNASIMIASLLPARVLQDPILLEGELRVRQPEVLRSEVGCKTSRYPT